MRLRGLALAVLLWGSHADAALAQDAEVIAIEQMMDEYFALLAEGDGHALASYYTPDAVLATRSSVAVGRSAIARRLGDLRSDPPPTLTRDRLDLLAPTVAVAYGRFEFRGTSGRYLRVLVKHDSRWLVARLQITEF